MENLGKWKELKKKLSEPPWVEKGCRSLLLQLDHIF